MIESATQPWPLTQAQLGIWHGQKLAGDASPAYNAAEAVEIKGEIDQSRFSAALQQAFAEAEGLNCVLLETDTGTLMRPQTPNGFCEFRDFSHVTDADNQARQWMLNLTRTPFALQRELGYRNAIIKTGDSTYLWYLCIHHLYCDGYGFALVQQRVIDLYNQAIDTTGKKSCNTPAFDGYTRLVEEDEAYQRSQEREEDRQFWLDTLAGMPTPVSLSDSTAPFTDHALRSTATIPLEAKARLARLHPKPAINWSHGLIAAVIQCIYRRTGAREVTIGLPMMGRMHSASLRVPAMVMNIIPLRVAVPEGGTFLDLVTAVAESMANTKRHQRYRYEHLRRDLNLVGGGQRVFGPVINIMPFDRQLRVHGQLARVHTLCAGPVEDLAFNFVSTATGALALSIEANPKRYSTTELTALQNELLDLIASGCAPDAVLQPELGYLSVLRGDELDQSSLDVVDAIEHMVKTSADAVALVFEDQQLSYQELWRQSGQIAQVLQALGAKEDGTVALCLSRGTCAITSLLAVLRLRSAFMFLDVAGPRERNLRILSDAAPVLVIYESDANWASASDGKSIKLAHVLQQADLQTGELTDVAQADTVSTSAYCVYTSGSTGTPKGVMVSRRALAEFVASAQQTYRLLRDDQVLQFAPMHFDACIEEIFLTLSAGACLQIAPQSARQSLAEFMSFCSSKSVSVLDLPTAFWHELAYYLQHQGATLPACVRMTIIGGEAAQPVRVKQWLAQVPAHVVLWNTYGPSEATVVATCSHLTSATSVTIGKPLPGRIALVVDEQDRPVIRGQAGQLALAGVALADGYHRLPEATAVSFREANLPVLGQQRIYKTGDKARVNSDGNLEFCGRVDDEMKISGQRVHLGEIETALRHCQNVTEAVVIAEVSGGGSATLHAFVTAEGALDTAAVRVELQQQIASVMLPATITTLASLPKNASGKLDRQALRRMRPQVSATPVARELTPQQALVMDVWRQVLGLDTVDLTDNFFLLGGQSLQTLSVANRLSKHTGREVSVAAIFEYPTVTALADHLAGADEPQATSLQQRLEQDTQLAADAFAAVAPEKRPWRRVLLTGASGFVGANLLWTLLRHTTANVVCLVRSGTAEQGASKVKAALAQQGLHHADFDQRVEILPADLEVDDLGLSADSRIYLQNEIQAIFHNGAITSVMRDYDSLKRANVQSCKALLHICAPRNIPLHFISTIAVGQGLAQLPEQPVPYHSALADGYQQSKWAAERICVEAQQRGFQVNVYRLPRVVGSLATGFVNSKDLMWNILRASANVGAYPAIAVAEPWVPVDGISQAIVSAARQDSSGQFFNLTPASQVELQQLCRWAIAAGIEMDAVQMQAWLNKLEHSAVPEDQSLAAFFAQRADAGPITLPDIANQQAQALLANIGLTFPDINQQHFQQYLASAQAQAWFAPTNNEEAVSP